MNTCDINPSGRRIRALLLLIVIWQAPVFALNESTPVDILFSNAPGFPMLNQQAVKDLVSSQVLTTSTTDYRQANVGVQFDQAKQPQFLIVYRLFVGMDQYDTVKITLGPNLTVVSIEDPYTPQEGSFLKQAVSPVRHGISPVLRDIPRDGRAEELLHEPHFPIEIESGADPDKRADIPLSDFDTHESHISFASSPPIIIENFEGFKNFPDQGFPPDTNGDVGPSHYVQIVNVSTTVFDKTGNIIAGPILNNMMWAGFSTPCETAVGTDPIVLYDHLADRWFIGRISFDGSWSVCIAVSQTGDPTGSYFLYEYSFGSVIPDYPKFGVWPDAYYMSVNLFPGDAGVAAFDRKSMLDGNPAPMLLSSVPGDVLLPSHLEGPPPVPKTPNVFMNMIPSGAELRLWEFEVMDFSTGLFSFTALPSLTTVPYDSGMCSASGFGVSCIEQPGTVTRLHVLADRLMNRLQFRNFATHQTLIVNHTVDVDGSDHAGIRWYELRNSGGVWSIHQQGTFSPDADNRWMGSAAMDASGNIAIGYSVSSLITPPSIRIASRLSTDPSGVLAQGEFELIAGGGSQTFGTSWGDYSSMSVNPVDDCTFWYTQQYYETTSPKEWSTRIGAFRFPNCQSLNEGDVNSDACVDRTDLMLLLRVLRDPLPIDTAFDLNKDGRTNIADARYLVTRFTLPRGQTCPAGP